MCEGGEISFSWVDSDIGNTKRRREKVEASLLIFR